MAVYIYKAILNMYRVENKYVLSFEEMFKLERRIQAVLLMDSEGADNGYKISSLYFDDIRDSMFSDTIDGVPERDKYRIRIYNDSFSDIKLEVKRKRDNRVRKMTALISQQEMLELMDGKTIADKNDRNDPRTLFNLAINTRALRPRFIVTYDRKAYVYEPGHVRITFDRNIRSNNQVNLFGTKNLAYDYPDGTGSVLEVKFDELLPKFIAQTLECSSMVQTANSKYGMCGEIYEGQRKGRQ